MSIEQAAVLFLGENGDSYFTERLADVLITDMPYNLKSKPSVKLLRKGMATLSRAEVI